MNEWSCVIFFSTASCRNFQTDLMLVNIYAHWSQTLDRNDQIEEVSTSDDSGTLHPN